MSIWNAIRRGYDYLSPLGRTLLMLQRLRPDARRTIVDVVEEWAAKTPDAPAIFYLDTVMS